MLILFAPMIIISSILLQTKSTSIIDFYGAFFVDNRISICTEFMDGKEESYEVNSIIQNKM